MIQTKNQSTWPGSGMENPDMQSDRWRPLSLRRYDQSSRTFAPSFIKSESQPQLVGDDDNILNGENDFSGKRYVWVRDPEKAFIKGWIVEDLGGSQLLVEYEDGSQRQHESGALDKVNPGKFDKADDMAELTHLNEPSVAHNLHMRYECDLIYTYSGLFLVAVNPYRPLPIYTEDCIQRYKGRSRDENKPHIFAVSDEAFQNMIREGENQSILVTGESGAGKTENTKKVIQYLAAVAAMQPPATRLESRRPPNLSQQILKANPILESFGNAQTIRNHNSSRFGKFIRIEFASSGEIAGAYIDWYLLEKSRVVKTSPQERNYHIFYQLLAGASTQMKSEFLLSDLGLQDFLYLNVGNKSIPGVSDEQEWNVLTQSFHVMGFSEKEQIEVLRIIPAILFLGNILPEKEGARADQAKIGKSAHEQALKACRLLGIDVNDFLEALLHPKVKAGREWVVKAQTPAQVRSSLDAIAKSIYERAFGDLVSRINHRLDRPGKSYEESNFIGVLDIAGFEIFEDNSFEQLCINYTNEKLQQFFNHHMFVLEQEEYAKEQIEWSFIDFGKDLQPTIDLIELSNPIGIFSCLDEESVMPRATDKTFTEKLNFLWDKKSSKYRPSRLNQGFILTHYAAAVEYSTNSWLEKNKDPLNDSVTRLLSCSSNDHTAKLFADCADNDDEVHVSKSRVKKGLFRTVAQRHKEQLFNLMSQLHSTHPHFIRCILPNHNKRPRSFNSPLVLDQLRCNGVLEGIRIARTGFPNRLRFTEFQQRYEVLCGTMAQRHSDAQSVARSMLQHMNLDPAVYRVGLTKVFFRAGILAELEEERDSHIRTIICSFQALARGFTQRRLACKRIYRAEATRIVNRNLHVYAGLCCNPWWRLTMQIKPLLLTTQSNAEMRKKDGEIERLQSQVQQDARDRLKGEEDARKLEIEVQRLQQKLSSETSLALDKEEILKRLQQRELELTEKLAGAIDDQEKLEGQLDELFGAKRNIESQLATLRTQLEQAGAIIERLEVEKGGFATQLTDLETRYGLTQQENFARDEERENLDRQQKMLLKKLELEQRKVLKLQDQILRSDQDLEVKYRDCQKELLSSQERTKDLQDDNDHIRRQISVLASTSTNYEDLLRKSQSELTILRSDLQGSEAAQAAMKQEKDSLASRAEQTISHLHNVQAKLDAMQPHQIQLQRELEDTKRLLNAKLSEDAQADKSRKMLQSQLDSVRSELFTAQAELSRERQSRDDVQMLGDHKLAALKEEHNLLNDAKITIEKELYIQQDTLRRVTEARNSAEKDRKELQEDLIRLRERYANAESSRIEAEAFAERSLRQQSNDRQERLANEMRLKEDQMQQMAEDRSRLTEEILSLKKLIEDSDSLRLQHDHHKERTERELVTVRSRLTASENDNRSLLNKIQQKNLDIARSHSRAGDSHRSRMIQIHAEKNMLEGENRRLQESNCEIQLSLTTALKQKEKLALDLEDTQHQVERDRKISRSANISHLKNQTQLNETLQKVESERRLKDEAQSRAIELQKLLHTTNQEVAESRKGLSTLQQTLSIDGNDSNSSWPSILTRVNFYVRQSGAEGLQGDLRMANKKNPWVEGQISELRKKMKGEMSTLEAHQDPPKRQALDELPANSVLLKQPRTQAKSPESGLSPEPIRPGSRQTRELDALRDLLQAKEEQNRQLRYELESRASEEGDARKDGDLVAKPKNADRTDVSIYDDSQKLSRRSTPIENSLHFADLYTQNPTNIPFEELFERLDLDQNLQKLILQKWSELDSDLTNSKATAENSNHLRLSLEVELRDARSELAEVSRARAEDENTKSELFRDFSDLQLRFDAEISRVEELESSLSLYKKRADEYFSKLEQAEIAILKSSRAEQYAKAQLKEFEEKHTVISSDREYYEKALDDLQKQSQSYDARMEDLATDLESATQAKKRLQHELEDYRSQRAIEIEDKELSMEQTRHKYQKEFASLTNELDIERENVIQARSETARLREEIEDLRAKWDDEVLNSSTWAKEKSRLELTVQDLTSSKAEAMTAHREAQDRNVSLFSQIRTIRSDMDEVLTERDSLQKEKKTLQAQLAEASDKLQSLMESESPSIRNAAEADRELLDLKSQLHHQKDVAAAAVGKMRKADALTTEMQKDITVEREQNHLLLVEKVSLEKTVKELRGKVVDLETKGFSSTSQDVRFLHGRIRELEQQVDTQEVQHTESLRSARNIDRTIKDLKSQLDRKDKNAKNMADDAARGREKIERLLATIDDLQADEAKSQLVARRAERDYREEREKCLRLERELEGWKSLRLERNSGSRVGISEWGSLRGHQTWGDGGDDLMHGGLDRKASTTKGFL